MNIEKLIIKIDAALLEVDKLVMTPLHYKNDEEPIKSTKLVLNLLKKAIKDDVNNINLRILRAMHDVGMSSYKDFEDTPLEDALGELLVLLYSEMPEYKELKPLRMEFGKGDPI